MRFIGKFTLSKNKCGKGALVYYGLAPVFLLLFSTSLHAAVIAGGLGTSADMLHNNDTVSQNLLYVKAVDGTIASPDSVSRMRYTAQNKSLYDTCHTTYKDSNRYAFGSRLFVITNMLYDAALTPNIGVGLCVTERISILADWMYARWSNRDKRQYWRIYGGDIEARYRIGGQKASSPLAGHHVGVYGSMACYDFQTGRSHSGVLSDKWNYAAGVSYTYSIPIATRLNIDFSLGVGYLWGTYKKQRLIDDCDVWLSTRKLGWFGPTRAGVSLVWLIGKEVVNKKKGGGK